MTQEQQQPFHDGAEAEPRPIAVPLHAVDEHSVHPKSPFAIGSSLYPIAPRILQERVEALLPEGKLWLRAAYEKCRNCSEPDRPSNTVVENREKLNMKRLRASRKRQESCFQAHPGLCIADPMYSSIKAFHSRLVSTLRSFKFIEGSIDGTVLILFSGHARKRQAEEATRAGASNAPVTADEFLFVFLSDQPDKRRKFMTFTKCRCIADEGCFQFGTHVGLVRTPQGSFEEYLSFAFSKLLRSRVRWWHAHIIEYLDLPEELQTVKAWISNAASTATMTTATITTTQQQYQTTI